MKRVLIFLFLFYAYPLLFAQTLTFKGVGVVDVIGLTPEQASEIAKEKAKLDAFSKLPEIVMENTLRQTLRVNHIEETNYYLLDFTSKNYSIKQVGGEEQNLKWDEKRKVQTVIYEANFEFDTKIYNEFFKKLIDNLHSDVLEKMKEMYNYHEKQAVNFNSGNYKYQEIVDRTRFINDQQKQIVFLAEGRIAATKFDRTVEEEKATVDHFIKIIERGINRGYVYRPIPLEFLWEQKDFNERKEYSTELRIKWGWAPNNELINNLKIIEPNKVNTSYLEFKLIELSKRNKDFLVYKDYFTFKGKNFILNKNSYINPEMKDIHAPLINLRKKDIYIVLNDINGKTITKYRLDPIKHNFDPYANYMISNRNKKTKIYDIYWQNELKNNRWPTTRDYNSVIEKPNDIIIILPDNIMRKIDAITFEMKNRKRFRTNKSIANPTLLQNAEIKTPLLAIPSLIIPGIAEQKGFGNIVYRTSYTYGLIALGFLADYYKDVYYTKYIRSESSNQSNKNYFMASIFNYTSPTLKICGSALLIYHAISVGYEGFNNRKRSRNGYLSNTSINYEFNGSHVVKLNYVFN